MPLTTLVGREREIAATCALLRRPEVRLVTLTGPGGIGKTRLAIAVAEQLGDAFADGVAFVSLAAVRDPDLVPAAIAYALDVRDAGQRSVVDGITSVIGDGELLLVLDNFEQVLDAAPVVSALLVACPHLNMLVTSRAVLRLSGEHNVPVQPLALADVERLPAFERLIEIESIRLFVDRAQEARADFALTQANAPVIAAICTRLDGLPLAIELAAARVRLLSLNALLAQLDQRLRLLSGGPRDQPPRQQTMRNTIAWSYDLLPADAQRVFRETSVFAGGWTVEAAEAICSAGEDALECLSVLIDHSLVRQVEPPDGSTRFEMLETIREFGREQLEADGAVRETIQRHATFFLELAERAQSELHGHGQREWFARLDADLSNIRAALNDMLDGGADDTALRLAVALGEYCRARTSGPEGLRWLTRALAASSDASAATRAEAYRHAGNLALDQGDLVGAEQALERAVALYRETGDSNGHVLTLMGLAGIAMYQGKGEQSNDFSERALRIARTLSDNRLLAEALGSQALGFWMVGEYALAEALCQESLTLCRTVGDQRGISRTLSFLGVSALLRGDLSGAARLGEEALAVARELDDYWTANANHVLGWIALERGDYVTAGQLIRTNLAYSDKQNEFVEFPNCLELLAGAAGGLGDAVRGATLLGAAENLRERIGVPQPPLFQDRYKRAVVAVRAGLSDDACAAAWAAGRLMSREAIVQFAMAADDVGSTSSATAPGVGLSKREMQVLRFIVEGRSNQEIAAALFISPSTVANHVTNLLNKLGLDSRTAAATWAIRNGIV